MAKKPFPGAAPPFKPKPKPGRQKEVKRQAARITLAALLIWWA